MILVDTSIWVAHLRGTTSARPLQRLLDELEVLVHPFVLGELVLGGIPDDVRSLVEVLPRTRVALEESVMELVDDHELSGRGIGWVDVHLLSAARLSDARLWTSDRRLGDVASALQLEWSPG